MNEAHQLLEKLVDMIVAERNRITLTMKSGSVAAATSQEEISSMAKNAIHTIVKLKRIEAMLVDVKSLFYNYKVSDTN